MTTELIPHVFEALGFTVQVTDYGYKLTGLAAERAVKQITIGQLGKPVLEVFEYLIELIAAAPTDFCDLIPDENGFVQVKLKADASNMPQSKWAAVREIEIKDGFVTNFVLQDKTAATESLVKLLKNHSNGS